MKLGSMQLENWIRNNIDPEVWSEIVQHGLEGGFAHIMYDEDLADIHVLCEDSISEMLAEYCIDNGFESPLQFLASRDRASVVDSVLAYRSHIMYWAIPYVIRTRLLE